MSGLDAARLESTGHIEPVPALGFHARPAVDGEISRTAAALVKAGKNGGWYVSAAAARGSATGPAGPLIDSLVIRLALDHAGHARGIAIFEDGRYRTGLRYGTWLPTERVGYRDLKAWVEDLPAIVARVTTADTS